MATKKAATEQAARVSDLRVYQNALGAQLGRMFGGQVMTEWTTELGGAGAYSPRLDVAVGPFAIHENQQQNYHALIDTHELVLRRLFDAHCANLRTYEQPVDHFTFENMVHRNPNARCFLAIEIENEVSRKHLMGGAINAAALGVIGIAVGWTQAKVAALVRLRSYLLFLSRVGKNAFDPANLLVLGPDQLRRCLRTPRR